MGKLFIDLIVMEIEEENMSSHGHHMAIAPFHSLFCYKSIKSFIEGVLPQCRRYYVCKHNTRRTEVQWSSLFFNILCGIHNDSQLSAFLGGKKKHQDFQGLLLDIVIVGRYESYFVHRRSHGLFFQRPIIQVYYCKLGCKQSLPYSP
jgi:hypothetical protein